MYMISIAQHLRRAYLNSVPDRYQPGQSQTDTQDAYELNTRLRSTEAESDRYKSEVCSSSDVIHSEEGQCARSRGAERNWTKCEKEIILGISSRSVIYSCMISNLRKRKRQSWQLMRIDTTSNIRLELWHIVWSSSLPLLSWHYCLYNLKLN